VWLTSACKLPDGTPSHCQTRLDVQRDQPSHRFTAMLAPADGWMCATVVGRDCKIVGTATFAVSAGGDPTADGACTTATATLRAPSSSCATRAAGEVAVEVGAPLSVAEWVPPATGALRFAEQSWPVPISTARGWRALAAASTTADGVAALSRRFCAFSQSAAMLLRGHHAEDLDTWLAVTLQRAATQYVFEKVDDRGPVELCFGRDEDCDGQSVSVCMFANALLRCHARVLVQTPDQRALLDHLVNRYSTAAFVLGNARSPKHGPGGSVFGHAYAALLPKVPGPTAAALKGALLVECTAPINPKIEAARPGILANDKATAVEAEARAILEYAHAPQIVVGVRELLPWYYTTVSRVITPGWSVSYPASTTLWAAFEGTAGRVDVCNGCNESVAAIRDALYHRVTGEQAPWSTDGAYCIESPPPGSRWALAATYDGPATRTTPALWHNLGPLAWNVYVDLGECVP